jgi:hypothetical protein
MQFIFVEAEKNPIVIYRKALKQLDVFVNDVGHLRSCRGLSLAGCQRGGKNKQCIIPESFHYDSFG